MSCLPGSARYNTSYCRSQNSSKELISGFGSLVGSEGLMYVVNIIIIVVLMWHLASNNHPIWSTETLSKMTIESYPEMITLYLLFFTLLSIVMKVIAEILDNRNIDRASYYTVLIPSIPIYLIMFLIVLIGIFGTGTHLHI